ncbi:hypothetical protein GQ44DRAFT_229117 [Phaeosphaeriaceae sp. PMI808]|nr:hypothetical protein GQ44DRAFT_229117 [Phaeosphaeriaceae sp. PMI808]
MNVSQHLWHTFSHFFNFLSRSYSTHSMAKLPAEQSLSSTWWQRFHKQSTIAVALTEVKIEESTTEDQNPPRLTLVRTATYPAATPSMKQDPSATQRQRSASTSCVPTDVRKDPLADDRRCIQTKRKEQRTAVSENVTKTFQSLLHKDSHQHGERTSSTSTAGFIQAIIRKRIQRLKNKKAEPDQRNGESSIIDSRVGSANTSGHTVTNEILSPDSKRPDKPNSNEDPNAAPTIRDRFRSDGLAIERRGRLGLEISASQADLIGQPTLVGQLPTTNHLESPFKNISRRPFRGRRLKHLMFGHRQRKREGQGSAMRETDTVEEQSLEGTPLTSDRAASEYGTLATRSHVGIRPRRPVDTIFDVPSFGSSSATTGPSNPTYHLENVEEWLKATNSNAHPSSNNHSGTSGHYFPAPPHDSVPHLNPMQHLNAGPYLTPIPPYTQPGTKHPSPTPQTHSPATSHLITTPCQ